MLKIDELIDDKWIVRTTPAIFQRERIKGGVERLRVQGTRQGKPIISQLIEIMHAPFQLLYVLHTTRGIGETGRFQSPPLSGAQLQDFLSRFEAYFAADARSDVWIRSPTTSDIVVWDRHDELYVYGGLEEAAHCLKELGFSIGALPAIGVHRHHYRPGFDESAAEVLNAFAWHRSPLKPEDEQ